MGAFNKKGHYVLDYRKVRTYVVPEGLDEFNVSNESFSLSPSMVDFVVGSLFAQFTPFVTNSFKPTPSKYMKGIGRPRAFNGRDYIDLWRNANAQELQSLRDNDGKFPEPEAEEEMAFEDDIEEMEVEKRKAE